MNPITTLTLAAGLVIPEIAIPELLGQIQSVEAQVARNEKLILEAQSPGISMVRFTDSMTGARCFVVNGNVLYCPLQSIKRQCRMGTNFIGEKDVKP